MKLLALIEEWRGILVAHIYERTPDGLRLVAIRYGSNEFVESSLATAFGGQPL